MSSSRRSIGKRLEKAVKKVGIQAGHRAEEAANALNKFAVNQSLHQPRHDSKNIQEEMEKTAKQIADNAKTSQSTLTDLTTSLEAVVQQTQELKNIQEIQKQLETLSGEHLSRVKGAVTAIQLIHTNAQSFLVDGKKACDAITNAPKTSAPKKEDGTSTGEYDAKVAGEISTQAMKDIAELKKKMDNAIAEVLEHQNSIATSKAELEQGLKEVQEKISAHKATLMPAPQSSTNGSSEEDLKKKLEATQAELAKLRREKELQAQIDAAQREILSLRQNGSSAPASADNTAPANTVSAAPAKKM